MTSVTVFMPVYNALPYLREAVDSIRRQTLQDWTFLIVDDGSTDGSAEYLRQLDDPRIQVLRQSHQGPAAASNWALALCRTEFFARMDADDVSHPRRLEEQLAFLCQHPEVGLLGTQIQPLGSVRSGRVSALATDHATIHADLSHGRHAMCNPTMMCRTALLREIGGYQADGALEDWAMFLRMAERTKLANLDRALLSYRIHAGSTNGQHLRDLRTRIAFVCQRAERQAAGLPALAYEDFLAARRQAWPWRRAEQWLEGYAMAQYRLAMAALLGPHPLRGYARLAWAAVCSPRLTAQRIGRVLRKRRRVAAPAPRQPECEPAGTALRWPQKYDLFGVQTSATNYDEACELVLRSARQGTPAIVSLHAVHALVTASSDPALRDAVNTFQIVATDGQPVRWALNLLHKTGLRQRVYGPELMLRLCRCAAAEEVPIYLYGSEPEVIEALTANLRSQFSGLRIAGAEAPPFRPLSPAEEDETIRRINTSGAKILFVGLGYPKQDFFAHRHRERIHAVQVCVGAAFDFHAGTKRMAPRWMQQHGLEWAFRLCQEPRRLWYRYLVTNTVFLRKLTVALIRHKLKWDANS